MPPRLEELAVRVGFPLVLLPVDDWKGTAFVGDVRAIESEIRSVQLVYLSEDERSGIVVSHLAPAPPDPEDPGRMTAHLAAFVSHFDPGFLASKAKRGRFVPFPPRHWNKTDVVAPFAGTTSGLQHFIHKRLPLRAYRAAVVRDGRTGEVCVASWECSLEPVIGLIAPLRVETARAFDAAMFGPGPT